MRIVTTILSLYILFLAATPMLSMMQFSNETSHCEKSCCQAKKETQEPIDQNSDCCQRICNPFMSCCNCYALTSQTQELAPQLNYSNQKFSTLKESLDFKFLSDAWNPPKIG